MRRGGKGKRGKRRGLQAARARMERKGTLGSYGRATAKKTERDKHSSDPKLRKKAIFAQNMRRLANKRKHRGGRS